MQVVATVVFWVGVAMLAFAGVGFFLDWARRRRIADEDLREAQAENARLRQEIAARQDQSQEQDQ